MGTQIVRVHPLALIGALVLTVAGLLLTAQVWRLLLAGFGHRPNREAATRVFFVGQLGKYVPGSVWSIGAQAQMGRGLQLPVRVTAATSLLFLGVNLASAMLVGGVVALAQQWSRLPMWTWLLIALAGLVGLLPPVVRIIAARLAGLRFDARLLPLVAAVMALVWSSYAAALTLLLPQRTLGNLLVVLAAFTLAYAIGVVVVIAPAGLGAREAVFVALLAPVVSLPMATALAMLARAVHTVADFGLALWASRLGRSAEAS